MLIWYQDIACLIVFFILFLLIIVWYFCLLRFVFSFVLLIMKNVCFLIVVFVQSHFFPKNLFYSYQCFLIFCSQVLVVDLLLFPLEFPWSVMLNNRAQEQQFLACMLHVNRWERTKIWWWWSISLLSYNFLRSYIGSFSNNFYLWQFTLTIFCLSFRKKTIK